MNNIEQPYNARKGHVYFLYCPLIKTIKIGFSLSAPLLRWRAFATTFPHPIICLGWCEGFPKDEREWHDRFANLALLNEWFNWSPKLMDEVKRACPNYGRDHMNDQYPPISKLVRCGIYKIGHKKVAKRIGVSEDQMFKWCLKTGILPPEKIDMAIKFYQDFYKHEHDRSPSPMT